MISSRRLQMAAIEQYISLLRNLGHQAYLCTMNGQEMKQVHIMSAQLFFNQEKRSGKLEDVDFDDNVVDLSDISDDDQYYSGFYFM